MAARRERIEQNLLVRKTVQIFSRLGNIVQTNGHDQHGPMAGGRMQVLTMKQIVEYSLYILVSALLFACAQSRLTSSWTDSSFSGPIDDTILVIGAFRGQTAHKIFEDSFVYSLTQAGAKALPSYRYGVKEERHSKQWLQQIRKESGARFILISHLSDETTKDVVYAAEGVYLGGGMTISEDDGVDSYHSFVVEDTLVPQETVTTTTDYIVAILFDSMTGKPIWTADSKSVDLNNYLRKDDQKLERLFIDDMKKHNLL